MDTPNIDRNSEAQGRLADVACSAVRRANGVDHTLCPRCGVRWKRKQSEQCMSCARSAMWTGKSKPNDKGLATQPAPEMPE